MRNGTSGVVVLHVIARMNVGGPAIEILELVSGIDGKEIRQHLITGQCDSNEADALALSVPNVKYTMIRGLGRGVSIGMQIRAFAQLLRAIRDIDPDIVHTHTTKAGVFGRIASIIVRGNRPLVHTYHGHLLHGYFGVGVTHLLILVERILARRTSAIISVSDTVQRELLNAGIGRPDQYRTIRSWSRFTDKMPRREARAFVGLEETGTVIAFVGRLTRIKRPDRFVAVVEEIFQRGLQLQVVVAGGGELEDEMKKIAEEKQLPIHFLGWRHDIDVILAASDILVLTSDNEGLPLVLLEAAALGVPFVASNVGGVSEIVSACGFGRAVEPNTKVMADVVLELLADLDSVRSQRDTVSDLPTFTREKFIEQHTDLYRNLVEGMSRAPD